MHRYGYEALPDIGDVGRQPPRGAADAAVGPNASSVQWRRPWLAVVVVCAWAGGLAVLQSSRDQQQQVHGEGSGTQLRQVLQRSGGSAASASGLNFDLLSSYPPLETMGLYGFDNIVEPYKNTTLAVRGGGASGYSYVWTIYRQNSDKFDTYIGPEVVHIFTAVSHKYTILLAEMNAAGDTTATVMSTATCKYIRREVHKTNDFDRKRTLAAMRVMYDLQGDEGRERYGPKYYSFNELLVLHLDRFSQISCSPWHGGTNFVLAHQAMSLQVEQSLQAMDPTLTLPWMDFTYEIGMGENWRDSPMFSDDWFGSWGKAENGYKITDSLFAGVKIPMDCSKPEKNGYCLLTNNYNNDDSKTITRSDQVCGLRTTGALSSCSLVEECLESTSYVEFVNNVDGNIHKFMHSQIGGSWDCPYGFDEALAIAPDIPALANFLEGDVAMEVGILQLFMTGKFLLRCPETCEGLAPSECSCYCPAISKLLSEGVSLYNASYYVIEDSGMYTSSIGDILEELPTTEQRESLVVWLANFMCNPGRFAPYSSPLGAPMDPLFMPSHAWFDAMLQYVQLTIDDFDDAWDNDGECWSQAWLAHLPWHDFLNEHNDFYTNQQLQGFFHPKNPSLPYIYDSFKFQNCKVNTPK